MRESLSQILNDACAELKFPQPSSYVGSSLPVAQALLAQFTAEGRKLHNDFAWHVLRREHTLSLTTDLYRYELPSDFWAAIPSTYWDKTGRRVLIAPLTSQQYQAQDKSNISTLPDWTLRIFGWNTGALNNTGQIHVSPTPTSSGNEITFEYVSNTWIRPQSHQSGLQLSANDRVWVVDPDTYEMGVFKATVSGTAGSSSFESVTPPFVYSDGNIGYSRVDTKGYTRPMHDTDVPFFDAELMRLGVVIRSAKADGLDYTHYMQEYTTRLGDLKGNLAGAAPISMFGSSEPYWKKTGSISDGSWG